jgi:hypothetical protein
MMERMVQPAGADLTHGLHQAIDVLIAVDPTTLADDQLHGSILGCLRAQARLAAVQAGLVSTWDGRGAWADDGSRSPSARLSRDAGLSGAHAAAIVRRSRQLARMRRTADALATGEISTDHVDLLAKAAAHDWPAASFDADEEMLLGFCQTLRFDHARRAVEYWIAHADADGDEERGQQRHLRRGVTASVTIDGLVHLTGLLDPVGGAAFVDELNRLERALHDADRREGRIRTGAQRRADALVEMAHRSRSAAPGGLRPRPLVTILTGEETFARICELADGHRLAPGEVVPLLGSADIERIVFDGPDRVMSVSRRRSFTGALRRAIEVRDRWCQHPAGCDVPASKCDVDHVEPRSVGGLTSQDNGRLGCPSHNRNHELRQRRPRDQLPTDRVGPAPTQPPGLAEPPGQAESPEAEPDTA